MPSLPRIRIPSPSDFMYSHHRTSSSTSSTATNSPTNKMHTFPSPSTSPTSASSSSASHHHAGHHSPSSGPTRRPKLMRACATEPSLAAPNITPRSSSVVASTSPTRRATDLLSRVAVYRSSQTHQPQVEHSSHDEADEEEIGDEWACASLDSGNYYSFPSFDTWDPQDAANTSTSIKEGEARRPG